MMAKSGFRRGRTALCALAVGLLLGVGGAIPAHSAAYADAYGSLRDVLLIGNAVSGTVSFDRREMCWISGGDSACR